MASLQEGSKSDENETKFQLHFMIIFFHAFFLFSTLVRKLFALPTELVATRLARPLLSRFVLLDETAVKDVVPSLLVPCKSK